MHAIAHLLTLLHSGRPKLYGVLATLSAIVLKYGYNHHFLKEGSLCLFLLASLDNEILLKWVYS